jgi:hypothetical protein
MAAPRICNLLFIWLTWYSFCKRSSLFCQNHSSFALC